MAFRLLVLVAVWVLGTSTLSLAQEDPADPSQPSIPEVEPQASSTETTLIVPDVRGLPYVFAKGELEDAGFSWRVAGNVEGFAVNLVAEQSVEPGAEVVDTGAPRVVLRLRPNPDYEELGLPENESPFPGTKLELVGGEAAEPATEQEGTSDEPDPAGEAGGQEATEPAGGAEVTETDATAGSEAAEPAMEATDADLAAAADPDAEADTRPPAFVVAGAPSEPLDEISLPQRAQQLSDWVDDLQKLTPAALDHFAYQHAWIVTGATFGWWRGADALRILIKADERMEARFDVGAEYQTEARAALAEVLRRSG